MHRLLVVDDSLNMLNMLERGLRGLGFEIETATNGVQASRRLEEADFEAVLCDVVMPSVDGLDVFEASQRLPNPPAFVFMTGYPDTARKLPVDPQTPVMHKPFEAKEAAELLTTELRLREQHALTRPKFGRTGLSVDATQLRNAARTSETILILGETGVGKTRLARHIHDLSRVRSGAFIVESGSELTPELAMSALFGHRRGAFTGATDHQEGAVGMASGGTLFLDEVGELRPEVQATLLRFLNDNSYAALGDPRERYADVRVVAATNRDLEAEVRAGRFREDLYHRLRVVELTVQPLRERSEDIVRLVHVFRHRVAKAQGRSPIEFTGRALEALRAYAWPGNIRELENTVRSLRALRGPGVLIDAEDLGPPFVVPPPRPTDVAGPAFELCFEARADLPDLEPWRDNLARYLDVLAYRTILLELRQEGATKAGVARKLGFPRGTLNSRLTGLSNRFGAFEPLDDAEGADPRADPPRSPSN